MKNFLLILLARAEWRIGFIVWALKDYALSTYHYYKEYGRVFILRALLSHARRIINLTDRYLPPVKVAQVVEPDLEPDFQDDVAQVVEELLPAAVQDELVYLEGLEDARHEMWDAFIDDGQWDYSEVYDEEPPVFVNVEKLS